LQLGRRIINETQALPVVLDLGEACYALFSVFYCRCFSAIARFVAVAPAEERVLK
jgi:hypothetical protein